MAAVDCYYQSIRLVPANVAWGLALVGLVFVAVSGGLLLAVVLTPLLAVPLQGITRLATLIVRRQDVVLSDAWSAWRQFGPVAVACGVAMTVVVATLVSNIVAGAALGGMAGGALVSLSGWGLVVVWLTALPFWLLLVDPAREAWSVRQRVTLVAYLLLAQPLRLAALGVVVALLIGLSAVLVAALLTISIAYAAVLGAHVVLPAADRLTAALGDRMPALRIEDLDDEDADDAAIDDVAADD
jgi:hypothetical protein